MTSPSMVQRSGDTLIIRSVVSGNRLFVEGDDSKDNNDLEADSEGLSTHKQDTTDAVDLPESKVKRNYMCNDCKFFTNNPRHHLLHLREVHNEKLKIYECPHCIYATKRGKSLLRHLRVAHENFYKNSPLSSSKAAQFISENTDTRDNMDEFENEDIHFLGPLDSLNYGQHCSVCSFIAKSVEELTAHERKEHISTKFFPCSKCNYVTHIKARYTKHVKYHSMPIIKCIQCDFATPYKWNLDRHMKNHGGTGSFCCAMCNFTADIKQSLTVHEMNHHTPPVGHGSNAVKRRNKHNTESTKINSAQKQQEHMNGAYVDISNKITIEEIPVSANEDLATLQILTHGSCSASTSQNDDVIYIEEQSSVSSMCHKLNSHDIQSQKRKRTPRPIPNLIPIQVQMTVEDTDVEPPLKALKVSESSQSQYLQHCEVAGEGTVEIFPILPNAVLKKKSESFFNKLQERLLTSKNESLICKGCGFVSKCLSEYSVHEKSCHVQSNKMIPNISLLRSTRCQNCRHRCKSSADLLIHMQNCVTSNESDSISEDNKSQNTDIIADNEEDTENSQNPHPMENVVFVWNPISQISDHETDNKHSDNIMNEINEVTEVTDLSVKGGDIETLQSELIPDGDTSNSSVCKKAFQCPHCLFWATTASRFHVHIVGHLNKKPFECSLCPYRSNWRWDITKHIRLKTIRDPEHADAKVLMTDETGRRNYSKYNKYLRLLSPGEQQVEDRTVITNLRKEMEIREKNKNYFGLPINRIEKNTPASKPSIIEPKKPKKTLWKCKKCNYRNQSKEELLLHVKIHSRSNVEIKDIKPKELDSNSGVAFRCGHCNQLSNWKHVIQRHCRLKHHGNINVVPISKPAAQQNINNDEILEAISDGKCIICPYTCKEKSVLEGHMQQHTSTSDSIFKCYFCPYFVNTEEDLLQHLPLHGVSDPEEYVAKIMGGGKILNQEKYACKRYKCTECPYDSNSRSQFVYHKQFHGLPSNTPYKCQECNYSVTKRHLLHQHMRVHRISILKPETSLKCPTSDGSKRQETLNDISYVWVSAKHEFHKMFKCHYCSYVNTQRHNIVIHEKLHNVVLPNSEKITYKCLDCKFICEEKKALAVHSKSHDEVYGKIHGPVDQLLPDKEQIQHFLSTTSVNSIKGKTRHAGRLKRSISRAEAEKKLHFCVHCPARSLSEQGWRAHSRFHQMRHQYKCSTCSYTARQRSYLIAHKNVHTEDYQIKTKMLQEIHSIHPDYKRPKVVTVVSGMNVSEPICIVVSKDQPVTKDSVCDEVRENFLGDAKQDLKKYNVQVLNEHNEKPKPDEHCVTNDAEENVQMNELNENHHKVELDNSGIAVRNANEIDYSCDECPAKFSKLQALNNHKQNHGSGGDFKCKQCNYSVKTNIYLLKHEILHERNDRPKAIASSKSLEDSNDANYLNSNIDMKIDTDSDVSVHKFITRPNDHFPPVLHADPQFGYLMHGNPDFIYPTYIKNGRQKEKRYKCHKCPSAFEKREQYKVHLSLHGSKQRYKCEVCDYSVKYYANYVQHMRKHQMNADAQAARKHKNFNTTEESLTTRLIEKISPTQIQKDSVAITVAEQQRDKILQRHVSNSTSNKDNYSNDKINHHCSYCPYVTLKRDNLEWHVKRHLAVSKNVDVNNVCPHCDFAAPHSNMLKDHFKIHFHTQKPFQPNGFFKVENATFNVQAIEKNCKNRKNSSAVDNLRFNHSKAKLSYPNKIKTYVLPLSGEVINCIVR